MPRSARLAGLFVLATGRILAWPFTIERLGSIASIVTIIGFPLAIYQLWDLVEQRSLRALQIAMHADQQLASPSQLRIKHAIQKGRPILEENGGKSTREELSDYLDTFEAIADAQERRLATRDVIYIWHGYAIARAFENSEVRKFIAEERREDPDFYTGFEALAAEMIAEEKASSSRAKRTEIRSK